MGDTNKNQRIRIYSADNTKNPIGYLEAGKAFVFGGMPAGSVLGLYSIVTGYMNDGASALEAGAIVIGDINGHLYQLLEAGDPFVNPEGDTYNALGVSDNWRDIGMLSAQDQMMSRRAIADWSSIVQYTHPVLVIGSDRLIYASVSGGDLSADPTDGIDANWITYEKLAGPIPIIASQMQFKQKVGLKYGQAGGYSPTDITVYPGAARDAENTADLLLNEEITKGFDNDWAEGANEGCFAKGVIRAANTWYPLFIIGKLELDGTVTTEIGIDSAENAVNLLNGDNAGPLGYTMYRRIGYVQSDTELTLSGFEINDAGVYMKKEVTSDNIIPNTSYKTISVDCPPNKTAILGAYLQDVSIATIFSVLIIPTSFPDRMPSTGDMTLANSAVVSGALSAAVEFMCKTDDDGNVKARSNVNGVTYSASLTVSCKGYYDDFLD